MNPQFRKGILELCVLSLINERDCYGYEMVVKISEYIDITEGTIYPILRRLTKEKYCKTYLRESTEGPPRKYYKITKAGEIAYSDQIEEWVGFIGKANELLGLGERNDIKKALP